MTGSLLSFRLSSNPCRSVVAIAPRPLASPRALSVFMATWALLFLWTHPAQAQARREAGTCGPSRVAVFDSRIVLDSAPGRAEAEARFQRLTSETRSRLKLASDSLQDLIARMSRDEAQMSPREREAAMHVLRVRELSFEELVEQLHRESEQSQQLLAAPMITATRNAAEAIRVRHGCLILIDRAASGAMVLADPEIDMTGRILVEMRQARSRSRG